MNTLVTEPSLSITQMESIVETLMNLDSEYSEVYVYYLKQKVIQALENQEIYGVVREILEDLLKLIKEDDEYYSNRIRFNNECKIKFGLVAADICLYL